METHQTCCFPATNMQMISVHSNISLKKKGPRGPFYLFLFFLRSDAGTKEQQKNEEKIEKKKEKKKKSMARRSSTHQHGPTTSLAAAGLQHLQAGRRVTDQFFQDLSPKKKRNQEKKNNHFKLLLCADVDHEEEVSFLRLEAFFVKTNIDV